MNLCNEYDGHTNSICISNIVEYLEYILRVAKILLIYIKRSYC